MYKNYYYSEVVRSPPLGLYVCTFYHLLLRKCIVSVEKQYNLVFITMPVASVSGKAYWSYNIGKE